MTKVINNIDLYHSLAAITISTLRHNYNHMNLLAPVSTIMTKDPIVISPNDSMKDVEGLFKKHNIHHLPVTFGGKLVGIVSKSDYLFFKRGFNTRINEEIADIFRLREWKVGEIMTTGLAKMDPNQRINVALDVFSKNLFHAILVTEEEKLVGIVTTLDIIKHLAQDKGAINSYTS